MSRIALSLVALLLLVSCSGAPNYWGCQNDVAKQQAYCDESLTIDDRLEALVSSLTLEEKVAMISPQPNLGRICNDHTAGVDRIGLPPYMWLVETNTAVASRCVQKGKCSTEFAGPLSMAASFNRTSWLAKGRVFGTEQRALMNIQWSRRHVNDSIGLTAYGPNINQQRDPRFGRSSELPGEDPLIAGQYAAHMVRGMQERDKNGYPKVLAYLKHFTAYNRETGRGSDDYNISMYDLFDSYLPQYEMAFKEANATGVMCSYNAINGSPSCANDWLLNQVMRKLWKQPNAHVTTDCGAVSNLLHRPVYAPDEATAAAYAIMNGTDVEMGSTVWTEHLVEAVQRGLSTEEAVDKALMRSYRPHFLAGRFDDPNKSEWFKFGLDEINSELHQQIQLDAALQGIVLLKHDLKNTVLPLVPGSRIAVLGPLGQTRAGLMSDYENDQSCWGEDSHACIPTLAESIRQINGNATMDASGVDIDSNVTDGIEDALVLAKNADVVVLCLGITKAQEREGVDREDTALPGLQENFAHQVIEIGKPVVMVLVNGGQLAIDNLVVGPAAIVEAFNPNTIGGTALAMLLFGRENRWGKLPYTLYPYAVMQEFDMVDHSMTAFPGRTYRYFTGKPLFPFGYGLSLTTFDITCQQLQPLFMTQLRFVCTVTNTGTIAGDEVLQVYHSAGREIREQAKHPVPLKQLVDFSRVHVKPGESEKVYFTFTEKKALALVNQNGEKVLYQGSHVISITNGVSPVIQFHLSPQTKGILNAFERTESKNR